MRKRETEKEQRFREMFEANYQSMFFAANAIVNDGEVARDIVDEVFARLWNDFDVSSGYKPSYLIRCTRNESLDHLRHEKIKSNFARLYLEREKRKTHDDALEDERIENVMAIISRMPAKTQFVMEQCYLEEKKYTEVAEIMGITTSGVKDHVMKGLKMLRNAFSVKYKKGQPPKK